MGCLSQSWKEAPGVPKLQLPLTTKPPFSLPSISQGVCAGLAQHSMEAVGSWVITSAWAVCLASSPLGSTWGAVLCLLPAYSH